MDQSHFARLADSMAEFIESRTGLEVGPIIRPPLLSRNQIILLGILFLISIPFMIKRIIDGETLLHDRRVWMAGALFVYFFSVSGGMYGIIRHTPMFLTDRADPNKLVFFYQGSGMQLGAEGFAVGFLYTLVGLMIAGVTHLLVKVESLQTQRFAMLAVMAIGWWAVRKVIYLDNWKTGYSIHTFFPSSWR
jgi:oligosaccharyltransferase complex subunit gamma